MLMKNGILKYFLYEFCLLVLSFNNNCEGFNGTQTDSSAWNNGFNIGIGYIMAHHPDMVLLQQDHVKSFEFFIEKNTDGSKPWHINYHLPSVGYAFQYYDFGADELLGKGYALDVYLKVALINKPNYFVFLKPAIGLGYIEKVYDRINNNKNVSINSHLNGIIQMQGGVQATLSKKLNFHSTVHFTHFSNGAISKPNQGINMPSFNLGLSYGIGKTDKYATVELTPFKRTAYYWLSGAATLKQLYPAGGDNYGAYIITAGRYRSLNPVWDWGYGIDLTYDKSIEELRRRENMNHDKFIYSTRGGGHIGVMAKVNKVGVLVNVGAYAFNYSPDEEFLYSKLGLRINLSRDLFAGVNLKTHYARADLLEWNIGYKFNHGAK